LDQIHEHECLLNQMKRKRDYRIVEPEIITFEPPSFTKDFVLVCSIGLNIGFCIGLMFL